MPNVLPKYPIYIPSKGRADPGHTASCLRDAGVPFSLVVEPQEADVYAARFGEERLLILPYSHRGLFTTRNWIKDHATNVAGAERHWQLDDNIRAFYRRWRGKRIYCEPGIALRACEDFTDRYENVGVSGLNYMKFVADDMKVAPLVINCHVYSCTLVNNAIPYGWRLLYNDDTDLCLQVLASGEWCTVLINAFMADKITTMKVQGGNTRDLYQGDGRLRMARSLERMWPGVVETKRRFHRPQHVVKDSWGRFDTPLRLKPGVDLEALARQGKNEYGMTLSQVAPSVRSPRIKSLLSEWAESHPAAPTPPPPPPTPPPPHVKGARSNGRQTERSKERAPSQSSTRSTRAPHRAAPHAGGDGAGATHVPTRVQPERQRPLRLP